VSFSTLALIAVAGIAGPLVSSSRKIVVPVIVGELLAGMALGKTGAGLIDATNPTVDFLGEIGFATLMFVAGMHVPLRNKALLGALRRGAIGAGLSAAIGIGGGFAIAHTLDIGHPLVWAVLLATGSAAIVLPALEEAGIEGNSSLLPMAWATVADVATIVILPLVLQPSHAVHAGLGALAVTVVAALVLVVGHWLHHQEPVHALRKLSKDRAWALDLRVSLAVLFGLCALADGLGTSIMVAGFAAGLIVAAEGGPRRLSDQVSGVANGLLVPIFFVVLGARLNMRALFTDPTNLELSAALVVGNVAVHVVASRLIRAPLWVALVVTAQLGVPAAVVKLGLAEGVVTAGQGAAIIVAALATLGLCATGTYLSARAPLVTAPRSRSRPASRKSPA
jgi:Kef-type K+ transport system membrane component KefB